MPIQYATVHPLDRPGPLLPTFPATSHWFCKSVACHNSEIKQKNKQTKTLLQNGQWDVVSATAVVIKAILIIIPSSHSKSHLPLASTSPSLYCLPSGVTQLLIFEVSELLATVPFSGWCCCNCYSLLSLGIEELRDVPVNPLSSRCTPPHPRYIAPTSLLMITIVTHPWHHRNSFAIYWHEELKISRKQTFCASSPSVSLGGMVTEAISSTLFFLDPCILPVRHASP